MLAKAEDMKQEAFDEAMGECDLESTKLSKINDNLRIEMKNKDRKILETEYKLQDEYKHNLKLVSEN